MRDHPLAPLRRDSIPAIEGYRAVAALMVLTTHVAFFTNAIGWPAFGPLLGRLDFGVPLFFVISGFVLFLPWVQSSLVGGPTTSVRRYLIRRWARIFPAYWLALAVAVAVVPANLQAGPAVWLQYATLTQIYTDPNRLVGLTQMWSLSVEVGFYLVLPLLALLTARSRRPFRAAVLLIAVLVLVSLGFRLLSSGPFLGMGMGYWPANYLDWFGLGMLAALVRAAHRAGVVSRWTAVMRELADDVWTCLVVGLMLFAIACTPIAGPITFSVLSPWESLARHTLYGLAAFFLLLPVCLGRPDHRWSQLIGGPVPRRLGTVSFGVFLWHLVLLELIAGGIHIEPFEGGFFLLWPLTAAASVVVAWLSWVLLERPLQRWSHRVSRREPATAANATTAPTEATTSAASGAD